MSSICRILLILSVIVCLSITGFSQQQGKKRVSLDMDDLSPTATSVETLNSGVTGWAPIAPEGGRFTVKMPGTVSAETQSDFGGSGLANAHSYASEFSGRTYEASYVDFTINVAESLAEPGFDGGQRRLEAMGLSVVTQNSIKYGSHPG